MRYADFIETNEWQVRETQTALAEAEAGDFATPQEVEALYAKWSIGLRTESE